VTAELGLSDTLRIFSLDPKPGTFINVSDFKRHIHLLGEWAATKAKGDIPLLKRMIVEDLPASTSTQHLIHGFVWNALLNMHVSLAQQWPIGVEICDVTMEGARLINCIHGIGHAIFLGQLQTYEPTLALSDLASCAPLRFGIGIQQAKHEQIMAEGQQLLVDGAPSEPFLHAAAMGYYEAIFSINLANFPETNTLHSWENPVPTPAGGFHTHDVFKTCGFVRVSPHNCFIEAMEWLDLGNRSTLVPYGNEAYYTSMIEKCSTMPALDELNRKGCIAAASMLMAEVVGPWWVNKLCSITSQFASAEEKEGRWYACLTGLLFYPAYASSDWPVCMVGAGPWGGEKEGGFMPNGYIDWTPTCEAVFDTFHGDSTLDAIFDPTTPYWSIYLKTLSPAVLPLP